MKLFGKKKIETQQDESEDSDDQGVNDRSTFADNKIFTEVDPRSCDLVVWGKWNEDSDGPSYPKFNIALNAALDEDPESPESAQRKVANIVFAKQFKLVLFDTGELFSWGINHKGCLGLGKKKQQTNNRLEKIDFEDGEKIMEVVVGNNHVLARAFSGKVYAWGDNTYGQVGIK